MAVYSRKYYADKQKEKRQRDRIIQTYHINQRMPFETNEEFKKRMSKRIVITTDENTVILGPFGKVLDIKDNVKF